MNEPLVFNAKDRSGATLKSSRILGLHSVDECGPIDAVSGRNLHSIGASLRCLGNGGSPNLGCDVVGRGFPFQWLLPH